MGRVKGKGSKFSIKSWTPGSSGKCLIRPVWGWLKVDPTCANIIAALYLQLTIGERYISNQAPIQCLETSYPLSTNINILSGQVM